MLRLHLQYLLSKFNVITIFTIILLYICGLVIGILSIPKELTSTLSIDMYFYNLISIFKLIIILLLIFLFAISATPKNDIYQLYLIDKRQERIKYYITKIVSLIIVTFVISGILLGLFLLFGLVFTDWYKIDINHLKFFIYVWLIGIMYGLFVYNLVKMSKSLIIMLIPSLIMIIEEAFVGEKCIKYLSYIFPIIKNGTVINLSYGVIHVIILIGCYFMIGLIKSYTNDIK